MLTIPTMSPSGPVTIMRRPSLSLIRRNASAASASRSIVATSRDITSATRAVGSAASTSWSRTAPISSPLSLTTGKNTCFRANMWRVSASTVMSSRTVTGSDDIRSRTSTFSSAFSTVANWASACTAIQTKNAIATRNRLNVSRPNSPIATARTWLTPAETRVARRCPIRSASSERRTRPPSIGSAGSRLNTASTMFTAAK